MAPRDRRGAIFAAAAWFVAFALVVSAVVVVAGFRGSVEGVAPFAAAGRELRPNSPAARVAGAAVDVQNAQALKVTLLQLPVAPFRAADHVRVRVDASAVPKGVEVALIWARASEPGKINEQSLPLDDHRRPMPMLLDTQPEWRGDIAVVALGVKGAAQFPWRVERVTLDTPGMAGVARGIVDDWTDYDAWDGRSINVAFGGREMQRAWLPPLAFVAAVLAFAFLRVRSKRRGTPMPIAHAVLPFVVAWLVVDVRWNAELTDKARETWGRFAGKSLDERHRAMEDGDLYQATTMAREQLPSTPARIFVGSDFEYFRLRAAYHLYPHNVLPVGWQDGKVMRPGDYVFLYQKADVRFDATHAALIWPDGTRSQVAPLFARSGAGLFRVE